MSTTVIIGAGLLGASLGQALTKAGHEVFLDDSSELNLRLAVEYGAGRPVTELNQSAPELVVVCVPPDLTARVVAQALMAYPGATVTDVASVKKSILAEVVALAKESDLPRYVGSHPMAGREKGGPANARADLFYSRPWVVCPHDVVDRSRIQQLINLAIQLNALPIQMTPTEHDEAVALVSHLPQLVSSALASQLTPEMTPKLLVAGQGLRDTARIASSDPELWIQILSRNAATVAPIVNALAATLGRLGGALNAINDEGALRVVHQLLVEGNQGVALIPGKHGGSSVNYGVVTVLIDDTPGQLAKLLTEVGEIGVNLEDMSLSHSPGAPIGIVELSVLPSAAETLVSALASRGWRLA